MKRYHKGTDVAQLMTISTSLQDMLNLYIIVSDSESNQVKKMAVYPKAGYISSDTTVIDDFNIEVRILRDEMAAWKFGTYRFVVYAVYSDPEFEDNERIDSNSQLSFRLIQDVVPTVGDAEIAVTIPETDLTNKMDLNGINSNITSLRFKTSQVNPAHNEGLVFYDQDKKALSYYNDETQVTVNLGQESLVPIYNNTGSKILNGSLLYPTGSFSDKLTVGLADNRYKDKCRLLLMATHDIEDATSGYGTRFGSVGGIDTSLISGLLYLGTNGGFTNVAPDDGHYRIQIGTVKSSGVNGAILIDPYITDSTVEVTDTNGFPVTQKYNTTLNFDNSTRTFTIAAISYPFHFYEMGVKYEKETPETLVLPDSEGLFVVYYVSGVLSYLLNPNTGLVDSLIRNNCIVSYVYWNATDSQIVYFGDERHGISMSTTTHSYLHFTRGAQYLTGFGIGNILADQNGNTNSHAQFSVEAGGFLDEDLYHSGSAKNIGALWRIYYQLGANNLRVYEKTGYAVMTDVDAGIGSTGRLVYNQLVGNSFQLTVVPDDDFVLCHVIALNCYDNTKKITCIMGQNSYTTVANARDAALVEISNLISTLPFQEVVPIGTIIFQTDTSETNAVKSHIVSVSSGINYVDWRTSELSQGSPASSHPGLTSLAWVTSGHTGTPDKIPAFNSSGIAIEKHGGALEYADNATAIGAGLVVGDFYRTGDLLKIVH
jgi:hypothetical protein